MTYNPYIHHRRSIRLKGYDYSSPGMYFITVCIQNRRRNLFGEINNGKMILNCFGEIIREQWHLTPNQFTNVMIDEFVVMPNHIHGILHFAGASLSDAHKPERVAARVAPAKKPTVGDVVGAFKSLCVHRCLIFFPKKKSLTKSYGEGKELPEVNYNRSSSSRHLPSPGTSHNDFSQDKVW